MSDSDRTDERSQEERSPDEPARKKPEPVRPMNVRAGMPGEGTPPEIEVEARDLDDGDTTWSVTAEGRARIRAGGGVATPVLQLVFRAEGRDPLEAMTVGRRLADLTNDQLVEALRQARPHAPPDREPRPFFEDAGRTTGRSRGS